MLTFLPAPFVGIIAGLLYTLLILLIPGIVLILALITLFIPVASWKKSSWLFLHEVAPGWWATTCGWVMKLTTKTEWEIRGTGELNPQGWYFLISNHQSWLDILALEHVFAQRIPILKFFMKKALLWKLPVAGIACYAMGFPFMERYSKNYLKKHPEKTGKDLEITRRACKKFKDQPTTVMSFVEGTRFSPAKHDRQASPYKHLLKPKAGGFAFVLNAMRDYMHQIIDVTLIYPDPRTSLWQFMCGKTKKIIVYYEVMDIPPELVGDYYQDQELRKKVHHWLNALWEKKDRTISNALKKS